MSHYFDENPQAAHKQRSIEARVNGIDFVFETDSGVFSQSQLDYGTRLLLETVIELEVKAAGRLLDLGCGYGVVGIVMKRVWPALNIVMCDINNRALKLAKKNSNANHVQYVDIIQSDGLNSVEGSFDLILTNPPIRAGKNTVHRFFDQSWSALNPGGRLYVVIQKKQGAPSAQKKLQELAGDCEICARSSGYWILRVIK
jgi:16S rRNA (guanine1207-N2)-methyltransferase